MVKITQQPVNAYGAIGDSVSFTVVAIGDAAVSYQWQYSYDNGVHWANSPATGNRTPSLTLEITEARLGYLYRVNVTVGTDTVTSNSVQLVNIGSGFSVVIQRNNSEVSHVTKSLTDLVTFTGRLRESCSITDPIILFESDLTSFAGANYMTIASFGRSYFINEIVSVGANLVEVHAHVDVLSSFAAEIKANTGIVLRQAHDWNLYLADDVIRCYNNPIIHTMEFPSGFSGSSYVLLIAGRRNSGIDVGQGGSGSGSGIDGGGTGNTSSKTTSGLYAYAYAQIGKPYWWGTFGQTADAGLLSARRAQYPDNYDTAIVGGTAFEDQYGERVHDCVGLVKGYRWSETPTSTPVYNASQDVNVQGLYAQCTRRRGTIDRSDLSGIPVGAVLFYGTMEHCGVYAGSGNIIEARGHAHGVVTTTLTVRTGFTLWGVPDWLQVG